MMAEVFITNPNFTSTAESNMISRFQLWSVTLEALPNSQTIDLPFTVSHIYFYMASAPVNSGVYWNGRIDNFPEITASFSTTLRASISYASTDSRLTLQLSDDRSSLRYTSSTATSSRPDTWTCCFMCIPK